MSNNMLYIQKDIKFWNTEDILPVSYKTGTTPEEFEEGAYLLLNEEQEQYHNDYPDASPLECWYMALTPEPQPTPQPAPQQTMQSQPMMDQGMMGQAMQGQPMMGQPMQGQPMMGQPMMSQPMMGQPVNVQPAQFQPFMGDLSAAFQKENIDLIMDVPLEVTVELGRTSKSIQEILDFAPGTIIELNKIAGEPIDVLVNGKYVAKGEVVVIEESFGVRITEIIK